MQDKSSTTEVSEVKPNVYQRMLAVIGDAGPAEKGGKAAPQMGGFAFHQIDEVVSHLRPHMVKHGVLLLPKLTRSEGEARRFNDGQRDRVEYEYEAEVELVLINADDPADRIEGLRFVGQGLDYGDKATGKAFSYALKTGLLALFQLRGQPDNETDSHERQTTSAEAPPSNPASMKITFGKHKGMTLLQVYGEEPTYLEWLAKDGKSSKWKAAAAAFLKERAEASATPPPDEGDERKERYRAAVEDGGWGSKTEANAEAVAFSKAVFGKSVKEITDAEFSLLESFLASGGDSALPTLIDIHPDYLADRVRTYLTGSGDSEAAEEVKEDA